MKDPSKTRKPARGGGRLATETIGFEQSHAGGTDVKAPFNLACELERIVLGGILRYGLDPVRTVRPSPADFILPAHKQTLLWLDANRGKWIPGEWMACQAAFQDAGLSKTLGNEYGAALDLMGAALGVSSPASLTDRARDLVALAIDRHRRKLVADCNAGNITWDEFEDGRRCLNDRLAAIDARTGGAASIRDTMLSRLHDPHSPATKPDYRLWLKGVPIASAGNVSSLVSLPKLGKSSVMMAVVAAGCGDGEYLGFKGNNPERRPVVHLDTEQSRYHHQQKLRTVAKRLGTDKLPDHVVSFWLTGERLGIESIREAISIAMERHEGKHPYVVLLDGGVDFLLSPNDEEASFGLIRELMAVASEFDCVILASIHFNPAPMGGASKSRGHFGSELERKSEAYLTITKDADESGRRCLFTKFAREKEIPEAEGVRFAWDEQAGMFEVVGDKITGYSVQNVLAILDRGGPTDRKQLKKLLRENVGGDFRTWEARIAEAHRDRLVTTSGRPAKVCLTDNGKCRLRTAETDTEEGEENGPF